MPDKFLTLMMCLLYLLLRAVYLQADLPAQCPNFSFRGNFCENKVKGKVFMVLTVSAA